MTGFDGPIVVLTYCHFVCILCLSLIGDIFFGGDVSILKRLSHSSWLLLSIISGSCASGNVISLLPRPFATI